MVKVICIKKNWLGANVLLVFLAKIKITDQLKRKKVLQFIDSDTSALAMKKSDYAKKLGLIVYKSDGKTEEENYIKLFYNSTDAVSVIIKKLDKEDRRNIYSKEWSELESCLGISSSSVTSAIEETSSVAPAQTVKLSPDPKNIGIETLITSAKSIDDLEKLRKKSYCRRARRILLETME